jgi:hypothetical protein
MSSLLRCICLFRSVATQAQAAAKAKKRKDCARARDAVESSADCVRPVFCVQCAMPGCLARWWVRIKS